MPGKINTLTEEQQNALLENKFGVKEITLYEEVQHFCPLGEQVGVTKYEIFVEPGEQLAELVQLHWNIQNLMGNSFTLESGADMVLRIVKNAYPDAHYVCVEASCGKNRHMPVKVVVDSTKE